MKSRQICRCVIINDTVQNGMVMTVILPHGFYVCVTWINHSRFLFFTLCQLHPSLELGFSSAFAETSFYFLYCALN